MWVNELGLIEDDRTILVDGEWLTDNHINAAQSLLKHFYPLQNGPNCLKERFVWPSIPYDFVQFIHVGDSHWACMSNKFYKKDESMMWLNYLTACTLNLEVPSRNKYQGRIQGGFFGC